MRQFHHHAVGGSEWCFSACKAASLWKSWSHRDLLHRCRTALGVQRRHLHFMYPFFILAPLLTFMLPIAGGGLKGSVRGGIGVKTITSNNALSNLPPQKPLAATSSLALSSVVALRVDSVSPDSACRHGSMHTSWHTSVRRLAVRLRTSLC